MQPDAIAREVSEYVSEVGRELRKRRAAACAHVELVPLPHVVGPAYMGTGDRRIELLNCAVCCSTVSRPAPDTGGVMDATQAMIRQIVNEAVAMAEAHDAEVSAEQRDHLTGCAKDAFASGATMDTLRAGLELANEISRELRDDA